MRADPILATRAAGTRAVSWLALTKIVASACGEPVPAFQYTVAPDVKLAPLIVIWKAAEPATTDDGLGVPVMEGPCAAVIGNDTRPEVMPPELSTARKAVPALATRLAGTTSVR